MAQTAATQTAAAIGPAQFAAALRAEQDALGAFVSLLREEQEVLIQGDADRLASLTHDKEAWIGKLSALGEERNRHLAVQNLAGTAKGMTTWLERNPSLAASVSATWKELLAQAESASQLNRNNGLLIESRVRQNRLKLAVLQMANASDGVYRADGQLRPLRRATSLGQV